MNEKKQSGPDHISDYQSKISAGNGNRQVDPGSLSATILAKQRFACDLQDDPVANVKIEKAKNSWRTLRQFFRYLSKHIILLSIATLLIIGSVILKIAAPAIIGKAIQDYLEFAPRLSLFLRQIGLVAVIYLTAWISESISGLLMSRLANTIIFRLRSDVFAHLQELSLASIDKQGIGELVSRLSNDLETISNVLGNGLITLLSGIISIAGILVAMMVLNMQLTYIVFAVLPVVLVLSLLLGRKVRKAFRENQRHTGILNTTMEEAITGIKVIKCFFREKDEYLRFTHINDLARRAGVRAEVSAFVFTPVLQFLTALVIALIMMIGGTLVLKQQGSFTIGLLSAFLLYAGSFFEPLRQMTENYNVMQSALAGAERIFEILTFPSETVQVVPVSTPNAVHGHIQFKDVSFGYEPDKYVLKHINLEVMPGQVIAVVGPTGAGKTTLVNLLSRFYETQEGAILLDGLNIRHLDIHFLRKQIGVVLQESFFFVASILENLCYGNPAATEAQARQAARLSGADAFISRLPQGYDTMLVEQGLNLSQGERQLLAIARVILANPKVLILDEALSNVDSLTEMRIQRGLLALMQGRTCFIIAHRLSTIKNADKVVVIHNKQIIEEGTHATLLTNGGFYARLCARQTMEPDIVEEKIS